MNTYILLSDIRTKLEGVHLIGIARSSERYGIPAKSALEVVGIVACTAIKTIVAGSTIQYVVASTAPNFIVSCATQEQIDRVKNQ